MLAYNTVMQLQECNKCLIHVPVTHLSTDVWYCFSFSLAYLFSDSSKAV